MIKQYRLRNYNFRLIAYVVILCIIGILVIGSAKESVQNKQIYGFIAGLIIMVIVSLMDYSHILKYWFFIYLVVIGLLVCVLLFGESHGGSTRWINIGFQFQPSEICKILLILFFSAFFTRYRDKLGTWKMFFISVTLAAVPMALILAEPDLSTTIILVLIFIAMIFVAGLSYKIIGRILLIAIPVAVIFFILIMKEALPLQDYQYDRIMAWIDPETYSDDAYQQQNSIMAIGSGMIWGKGLNNNSIVSLKNGNFIVEPKTDFIFAVLGEETGFVGCITVIILLFLVVLECVLVGARAKDLSGKLICCGVASLIGFQSFVNICVATGLMPNTGIPLPFISYGLTSLISLFIGIGFVLNVGLQPRKYGSGEMLE